MSAASANTRPFRISVLLRRIWPSNTAKLAAQAAQCSVRSAQNWCSDVCDPSAETLIKLAQGNAELRAELIKLLEGNMNDAPSVDRRMASGRADGAACSFGGCPVSASVTAP